MHMLVRFYQLFIFALPFSAVVGIPLFGELTEQLTTYILILTVPFLFFKLLEGRTTSHLPPLLILFTFCLLIPILLSFLFNITEISDTSFKGRSAINKFISSILVIGFGLYTSYLTHYVFLQTNGNIKRLLFKPLLASFVVCMLFSVPEILSWFHNGMRTVYLSISSIVHSNQTFIETPFRLRSVGSEPSFIGIYFTFLLPWLFVARSYFRQRTLIAVFMLIAIIMILLTNSRTAYIALVLIMSAWIYVGHFFNTATPQRADAFFYQAAVIFPIFALIIFCILQYNTALIEAVNTTDNISNLTRFATFIAAFETFKVNLLFGTGFGLTSFFMWPQMPDWGFWSYEIMNYVEDMERTSAPPIYSMFVRIAGDIGLLGLLGWYGFWSYALMMTTQAAKKDMVLSGYKPVVGVGLIVSILSFIALDLSTGSFRLMNYWITLGIITYYLHYVNAHPMKASTHV